jgi:hypothetical protein
LRFIYLGSSFLFCLEVDEEVNALGLRSME